MASRGAHRNNKDTRKCGAKTKVVGQSTVFVNDELWAVRGDHDDHGDGHLIDTAGHTVFIEDKPVIVHGPDKAVPDKAGHVYGQDETASGSDDVFAYD